MMVMAWMVSRTRETCWLLSSGTCLLVIWQSRCKPDLIFEVKDLIDGGVSVDWSELCLGLEELLFDEEWYSTSGLRNRGRIFGMLGRIKELFQSILELNV